MVGHARIFSACHGAMWGVFWREIIECTPENRFQRVGWNEEEETSTQSITAAGTQVKGSAASPRLSDQSP
jgi:hypothetical protein